MNILKKIKIKCLVVGSGISTDFFLRGINKKNLNKILVLTGQCNNKENIIYNKKNILLTRSSEFGGLSKKWLGTSKIYKKNSFSKLNFIGIESSKLQETYLKENIYTNKKFKKKNYPLNIQELSRIDSKKLRIYESLNLKNKNGKKLEAKKYSEVKYINFRLNNFKKIGNKIISYCYNDKEKIIIESNFLILGTGTIDTAIQLINFFKLKKIRFRHQPYCKAIVFKNNKNKEFKNFDYPIYNFEFKNKLNFSGSIGTFSKRVFDIITNKKKKLFFFFILFKKFLFNKIIFFNFFLDSKINEFSIEKSKGSYYLKSKKNKKYIESTLKKKTDLFFFYLKKKFNGNIFFSKVFIPKIGDDKHYFGIKNLGKGKLKLTSKCQLAKSKNIFIIDQSV